MDARAQLSDTLKRVAAGEQTWFTWRAVPRLRLLLGPVPERFDGGRAVFVHRGLFGFGSVCAKDGLWVADRIWLTRPGPRKVYLRRADVRAVVLEVRPQPW